MTPFSLQELGLSEEEIAALEAGAFEAKTAEATPEEHTPPAPEPIEAEHVAAPPVDTHEPVEPLTAPDESSYAPAQAEPVAPIAEAAPTEPPAEPAVAVSQRGAPSPPVGPPTTSNDVLDNYLSLLEADPQNYALRLSVARVGGQIGMTDLAMQQYKQLIKQNELLDEVMDDLNDLISDIDDRQVLQRLHRLLGDIYSKQGRFREAIEEYSWTLSRPRNAH